MLQVVLKMTLLKVLGICGSIKELAFLERFHLHFKVKQVYLLKNVLHTKEKMDLLITVDSNDYLLLKLPVGTFICNYKGHNRFIPFTHTHVKNTRA